MLGKGVLLVTFFFTCVQGLALTVSTTGGNASSPLLYGIMFEDINHSGDGALHGQLMQNNGFQGTNATLTAYGAAGDVTLFIDSANPLTTAITKSLKVSVPSGTTGHAGISKSGYWGIPVNEDTYTSYFWVKGETMMALLLSRWWVLQVGLHMRITLLLSPATIQLSPT